MNAPYSFISLSSKLANGHYTYVRKQASKKKGRKRKGKKGRKEERKKERKKKRKKECDNNNNFIYGGRHLYDS